MSSRIILFALAIIMVAIFVAGRAVRQRPDSPLPDGAPTPQPLAAADVESMRRLAVAKPTPPEIAAVAAAFNRYMQLDNNPRLAELYADEATLYEERKQSEDDPEPRGGGYSGREFKAYLSGSGPAPMPVEEEPEYSTWSDISYRLESWGHVTVLATRHSNTGYATPHKLVFGPESGTWLIYSEMRTRLGPYRRVRKPQEPDPPASY